MIGGFHQGGCVFKDFGHKFHSVFQKVSQQSKEGQQERDPCKAKDHKRCKETYFKNRQYDRGQKQRPYRIAVKA